MLALRLYGPQDIRLEEVPIPVINDDEILLKTDAAAVCGTDVRMWQNGQKGVDAEHPLILGHEFAGTIVEVGKNVPFYQVGMQVAMQPNIGSGICDRFVDGKFHLCDDYRAFGINMDGAFTMAPSRAQMRKVEDLQTKEFYVKKVLRYIEDKGSSTVGIIPHPLAWKIDIVDDTVYAFTIDGREVECAYDDEGLQHLQF